MQQEWRRLIEAIHHAPHQCVVVVTGGGASAIAELLVVPGGSRSVLEATVPYSAAALAAWLGRQPEHFCTEETALAMAAVAFERACRLTAVESAAADGHVLIKKSVTASDPLARSLVGIACTAALVSDRPKKGDHRCHIAVQSASMTATATITLHKGARDRAGEEQLVGQLILVQLAHAMEIDELPSLELLPEEKIIEARTDADSILVDLRIGRRDVVWSLPGGTLVTKLREQVGNAEANDRTSGKAFACALPRGVLCGAFNPLHYGHEELRRVAEQQLGGPVYYEMSLRNVDKPPLDYLTIDRRRAQFTGQPLALTSAPTFAEKSRALPGVVFVVGVDTAERVIQPRYYGGSVEAMRTSLAFLRDQGCRFLVAGRRVSERFETLEALELPPEFTELFAAIPAKSFRADVTSTELRARSKTDG